MEECNTFNMINEEFSAHILGVLLSQRKLGLNCDLTFNINKSKIIKAHSIIIRCNTTFFDDKFKHETNLQVSCDSINTFEDMINFMYKGHIEVNECNVEDILKLSSYFFVDKLIQYCGDFLKTNINIKNCFQIRDLCELFALKDLKQTTREFIKHHIKEICQKNTISEFKSQKIFKLLTDKDLNLTVSHYLDLIASWVNFSLDSRETEFMNMISFLDWSQSDSVEIFTHLDTCLLYPRSQICLYFVLKYLNDNSIFIPTYETRYQILKDKYEQDVQYKLNINIKQLENKIIDNNLNKINIQVEIDNSCCNSYFPVLKSKRKQCKKKIVKHLTLYRGAKPGVRLSLLKTSSSIQNRIIKLFKESSDDKSDPANQSTQGVSCRFCSDILVNTETLEQHLSNEHSKDITYKCSVCNFTCQWQNEYFTHMKEHFPGPNFKCDSCEFVSEDLPALLIHRVKHCNENTFQCTFCTFTCRLKQNFLSHLRIHCPEKPYKCDCCDATFRFKQLLDSHALTHSEDQILTCDSCGFNTKILSHLIAHKRIHTNNLHKCTYPHCKYSTSKKSQLLNHSKIHNGVRPHSCNVCGRGFMEKSHLVRHERIHLDEKPFKCSQCDYASSRRDKLKEHFSRHHGETASTKVPYKARNIRNGASIPVHNHKTKTQSSQESNGSNISYSTSSSTPSIGPPISNDLQELIMHHQNLPSTSTANNITTLNSNYHHFPDSNEFHGHNTHGLSHGPLPSHNPNPATHHPRSHPAASTTAAAVAAMMLDPRFHHNSGVAYHSSNTPVSMAMAAVQTSQHIQGSVQHGEYPTSLQTCMSLF